MSSPLKQTGARGDDTVRSGSSKRIHWSSHVAIHTFFPIDEDEEEEDDAQPSPVDAAPSSDSVAEKYYAIPSLRRGYCVRSSTLSTAPIKPPASPSKRSSKADADVDVDGSSHFPLHSASHRTYPRSVIKQTLPPTPDSPTPRLEG
ncbi:hypothetical protein BKA70DRAFT_1227603 [Coprinopsis sp. MPI-PUGE-AT-0042]|nr:hypothetical protein BKA70DRAFT_1227603 [Coprinopsis sp. MPI-PUGE-AT-0042]